MAKGSSSGSGRSQGAGGRSSGRGDTAPPASGSRTTNGPQNPDMIAMRAMEAANRRVVPGPVPNGPRYGGDPNRTINGPGVGANRPAPSRASGPNRAPSNIPSLISLKNQPKAKRSPEDMKRFADSIKGAEVRLNYPTGRANAMVGDVQPGNKVRVSVTKTTARGVTTASFRDIGLSQFVDLVEYL